MPQYQYRMYNPGQYPAEVQEQLDQMSADGWHVHTALPNYTELYVVWEKDGAMQRMAAAAEAQAAALSTPPVSRRRESSGQE